LTPQQVAERLGFTNADALRLASVERAHVFAVIGACHGNLTAASRALGLHRRTLQRTLKQYRHPIRALGEQKPAKVTRKVGGRRRRADVAIDRIVELAARNPEALRAELARRIF
jgi:hypothetical protein